MGLFKKLVGGDQPRSDQPGKPFGHAAFDPADIDDARRGYPAVSLEPFAGGAGLAYRRSDMLGAFVATLPSWPDYLFNVCAGAMPSGRYGMLAHELLELETRNGDIQEGGSFYDVRMPTRFHGTGGTGGIQVLGVTVRTPTNEPFATSAVWLPTTTVHVRVPETNLLPLLRISKRAAFALQGTKLDQYGVPGYRVRRGDDDQALIPPIAAAVGPFLNARPDAYVDLRVRYGLIALTVNGYRAAPQDLEHLIGCADGIATALVGITPAPSKLPFANPGAPAGTIARPLGIPLPHPVMVPLYAQAAAQLGMHNEDGAHLMMIHPRCPIPGIPSGVLSGQFPGRTTPCRLVWFEQGGRTSGSVRGGVLLPASPGASTPLGGVLVPETGMYVEVVDGIASFWRQQRSVGSPEPDQLLGLAAPVIQATGLADL